MKANKRIILLAALVVSSFVANAQSEQWKKYGSSDKCVGETQ